MRKLLLSVLILISIGLCCSGQKWDLRLDKDNVKVYTRKIAGSNVEEFKGEVTVKSNMSGILSLIDSISEYPKWMYKCSYAERIKRINPTSGYTYTVLKSSWPVSDRDICAYYSVKQDTLTKVITVTLKGVKDYLPEKSGIVRVPDITGFWQLTPLTKGSTKVVYQVHCESGGIVPAAIVNEFITNTPYTVLVNLKNIVESPQYPKKVMKIVKEL